MHKSPRRLIGDATDACACDEPRCLALGRTAIRYPTDELGAYGTFGGWSGSVQGRRLDAAPKGKLRSAGRARSTDTMEGSRAPDDRRVIPTTELPAGVADAPPASHARFTHSSRGGLH